MPALPNLVPMGQPPVGPPSASLGNQATPAARQRSCLVCRQRKVRCDKQSPCSNCRRADIACVFPSARTPRWARKFHAVAGSAQSTAGGGGGAGAGVSAPAKEELTERLHNLEKLVKNLTGQLDPSERPSQRNSESPRASPGAERALPGRGDEDDVAALQQRVGRLVLENSNHSRYISSDFWTHLNEELDDLKARHMDLETDNSDDDSVEEDWLGEDVSKGATRARTDRNSFLFRHNVQPPLPGTAELRPLPAQIPLLFQTYLVSVNSIIQVVHVPAATLIVQKAIAGTPVDAKDEALLFAMYYAAVTAMEEEDVGKQFGAMKTNLCLQYRLGLEHALARADFLASPDMPLLQAFVIFIYLLRRHDSPQFVWMMTGIAIRMAMAMGLHRDGETLQTYLSPYQIEMRRRLWWSICVLDVRTSEDQGTDLSIGHIFDTKTPGNYQDADLTPDMKTFPPIREGLTDISNALVSHEICILTRAMMLPDPKSGAHQSLAGYSRLIDDLWIRLSESFFNYVENLDSDIRYFVGVSIARLVMSKMKLILYLPALFGLNSALSQEIRDELFFAAIEVAEYNHALNAEPRCRHWRWLFQTYTQWQAIAYLLIELCRRPWSPIVERAWLSLHSPFLIPRETEMNNKREKAWLPLRMMVTKARRYRSAELSRLKAMAPEDRARELEKEVRPPQGSLLASADSIRFFQQRWETLMEAGLSPQPSDSPPSASESAEQAEQPFLVPGIAASTGAGMLGAGQPFLAPPQGNYQYHSHPGADLAAMNQLLDIEQYLQPQAAQPPSLLVPTGPPRQSLDPSGGLPQSFGHGPWLWADADPSVDVFADVGVGANTMGVDETTVDINMDAEWLPEWLDSLKDLPKD